MQISLFIILLRGSELQENPEANLYEEFHLASAEIPSGGSGEGQQQHQQEGDLASVRVEQVDLQVPAGEGNFEQGIPYDLDASMSPEGRKEFDRY